MILLVEFRQLLRELKEAFHRDDCTILRSKIICGHQEYVTDADLYSQKKLIELAKKYHPNSVVISEELDNFDNIELGQSSIVVMDPLDGTHNYMFGLPMWGVSYTVFSEEGNAIESYIGLPEIDVLIACYHGEVHHYSIEDECYDELLSQASGELKISKQLIAYDNQFYKDPANVKRHYDLLIDHAFTTRITGSSVFDIAMIVLGRINARIWHNVNLYDIAPAFAFIRHMGFLTSLYSGEDATLKDQSIVATLDPTLHSQLRSIGIAIDYNK